MDTATAYTLRCPYCKWSKHLYYDAPNLEMLRATQEAQRRAWRQPDLITGPVDEDRYQRQVEFYTEAFDRVQEVVKPFDTKLAT